MTLPELCVRRPVFTTMLIMMPVVLGLMGFARMGVDLFPQVEIPVVFVTTARQGASAEEMETGVTKKIEEQINTIAGIDELQSSSREGMSTVIARFLLEKDRDVAQQEVTSKINAIVSQLPPGTNTPIIDKFDIDASPVMSIAVSSNSNRSLKEVTEIADKRIAQMLSSLPGVGNVTMVGGQKRAIQITLDTDKLQAYHLGVNDVWQALQNQNLEIPGGRVDQTTREVTLRTMGRIVDPRQFENIIVANIGDRQIRLQDVGQAEDSYEEQRGLSLLDGDTTVQLVVQKQSGTNTVEVIDTVKARLAELKKALDAGGYSDISMQVVRDQGVFIKASIHEVQKHLVIGACLVSLTILLFLRDWRTMVMASISIPVSIIGTFFFMYLFDFTFNNITMLALVMAVGLVIDDAIVVHENIFRWMEEKGYSAWDAALGATKEIGLAVMATTFSLVVIFLPVAFMSGVAGRFIRSFGITMAVAIMVSLFVSFTLTPMLCSRFLRLSKKAKAAIARGEHSHHSGGVYGWIAEKPYLFLLRWSLKHRWVVVSSALFVIVSMFPLPFGKWLSHGDPARQAKLAWANYPGVASLLSFDFLPPDDQGEWEVAITTPSGWTLEHTRSQLIAIKDRLAKLPGVQHTLLTIGDTTGKQTRATGDVTKGNIYVRMLDIDERPKELAGVTQFTNMAQTRQILRDYPDLRSSVQVPAAISGGGTNADVELTVSGPDLDGLTTVVQKLMDKIRQVPGMTDVDITTPERSPELRVVIDRARARDLGLDIRAVASTLQILVGGQIVGDYKDNSNGEQYDVWVRAALPYRSTREAIAAATVMSPTKGLVELSNIASLEESRGPAQIDHYQRQRKISIVGNTEFFDKQNQFLFFRWTTHEKLPIGSAMAGIQQAINDLKASGDMPPMYTADFLGRAKTQMQMMSAFVMAFLLSLTFMYMILAAQFESFVHPITILLAVPLTVPFAIISLIILGQAMSFFGILGVFLLFGIVKKNGILQVDYANKMRAKGMGIREAVLEANKTRLRPILMTTMMLVAGMLPIALGQGAGSAARSSMAKVIVGGQLLSLLLTLLVTPVAYTLFDDLANIVKGKGRADLKGAKGGNPPPLPAPRERTQHEAVGAADGSSLR
jgi:hydrophobic/amphiphilic exporter-1 (mainly G- bacteria), HAE1 family